MPIRAVVWGENHHEQTNKVVAGVYPDGMHAAIAAALNADPEISGLDRHPARARAWLARRTAGRDRCPAVVGPRRAMAMSPTRWSSGWSKRSGPEWG